MLGILGDISEADLLLAPRMREDGVRWNWFLEELLELGRVDIEQPHVSAGFVENVR